MGSKDFGSLFLFRPEFQDAGAGAAALPAALLKVDFPFPSDRIFSPLRRSARKRLDTSIQPAGVVATQ
jgi:hypothetical protein